MSSSKPDCRSVRHCLHPWFELFSCRRRDERTRSRPSAVLRSQTGTSVPNDVSLLRGGLVQFVEHDLGEFLGLGQER
jgi:hypothetical protein